MIKFGLVNEIKESEVLVLPLGDNTQMNAELRAIDEKFNKLISRILAAKDFEGKKLQTSLIYTHDEKMPRIILLGCGKEKDLNIRTWKQIVGAGIINAQAKKAEKVSIFLPQELVKKFGVKKIAEESAVAAEVANYSFDEHKSKNEAKIKTIKNVDFVFDFAAKDKKEFTAGWQDGQIIGAAMNWVRHLGNTPPHILHPEYLASEAKKLAKKSSKIKIKVLPKTEIEKLGMGCLLAVASGSKHEPKFIIAEYNGGSKKEQPVVFVGKGITFDTGGVNIKPFEGMMTMKFDMLGGATVLGIIRAAAELGLRKNIVALVPTCENMPSGTAYRPDDILVAMNGTTVEVANTDAEGRLILADALCYAQKYNPEKIIDLATLTGHCLVAIGNERSGLFSNDEDVAEKLTAAADEVGEQLWRLPLGEEYSEAVKSDIADLRNIGGVGRPHYAGASTAAAFLQNFIGDKPWAHIDLSSAYYERGGAKTWIRGGANGFGVETMIRFLRGE